MRFYQAVALLLMSVLFSGCSLLSGPSKSDDLGSDELLRIELVSTKADALYKDKKYDEAKQSYLEVLSIAEDDTGALYRLGNIYFINDGLDQAAAYFMRAIEINPRLSKAHYNLAIINLAKAEQNFKFYTATTDPASDLEAVTNMLNSIEQFKHGSDKKVSSLDKIAGHLER